jgi:hypothetical protein
VKRSHLLRALRLIAKEKGLTLTLIRRGAGHDLYQIGSVGLTIARHTDVPEITARITLKNARKA